MAEIVDYHRTMLPYQGIGKLHYTKKAEHKSGTGFAVSVKGAKNIIFTSASNLHDEMGQATSIEFIPALKSNGSRPYGSFQQVTGGRGIAWFVHPNWDPISKPQGYDLGAIKFEKNKNGKDIGDVLDLLDVDFDLPVDHDAKWNIIWYDQLTMFQSASRYERSSDNGRRIHARHDSMKIPIEAVGAPWIIYDNDNRSSGCRVNGHCTGYRGGECALSPYYSLGLIKEVLNQM